MYEEAKAASASQIDRFYLSFCSNGDDDIDEANSQNLNPVPVSHQGLLSAAASSLGGLAAATVRRSSFQGASRECGGSRSNPGSLELVDSVPKVYCMSPSPSHRYTKKSIEATGSGDEMKTKESKTKSQQQSYPSSPRSERNRLVRSTTPNNSMLTVKVQFSPVQSLPNLVAQNASGTTTEDVGADEKSTRNTSNGQARAAPGRVSSYPPTSPKSLQRASAVHYTDCDPRHSPTKSGPPTSVAGHVVSVKTSGPGSH